MYTYTARARVSGLTVKGLGLVGKAQNNAQEWRRKRKTEATPGLHGCLKGWGIGTEKPRV